MVQVIEVPDTTPRVRDTPPAAANDVPSALEYRPPELVTDEASVLSVLIPDGTGGGVGGGLPFSTRTVTADTTGLLGELLEVDATAGPVTVTPPPTPPAGGYLTIAKVDETANQVVFAAPVSGDDEGAAIVAGHAAATFLFDGGRWLVVSVNTAYSGDAALAEVVATLPEAARDTLAASLVAGSHITITPDDDADTITISASLLVDDLADTLVAGAGITLAADTVTNQLIITATAGSGSGGITTEDAQDVVNALFAAGTHTGISFTYDDTGNAMSATVTPPTWAQVTDKPTFAAVATSGSATDLTTGVLPDTVIPAGITRDTELTAGLATKAATLHTHPVTDLTTTGIRSATTFLRGDGAWAAPTVGAGPVGGVQISGYAPTVTPNAANGEHFRYTAQGSMTINPPSGGVDGQRVLVEVQAFGGSRSVGVATSVETSAAAPQRSTTIPSGQWGYFALLNRQGTYRLMAMDPLPPT